MDNITSEFEIDVKEYIENTFTRVKHFDTLILLLEKEFVTCGIALCREGNVTLVPMIATDIDTDDEKVHRFTTMSEAFEFAIARYRDFLVAEAMDNINDIFEEFLSTNGN